MSSETHLRRKHFLGMSRYSILDQDRNFCARKHNVPSTSFPLLGDHYKSKQRESAKLELATYCSNTINPFPFPSMKSSKAGLSGSGVWLCTSACNISFVLVGMTSVSNGRVVHVMSCIPETANSAIQSESALPCIYAMYSRPKSAQTSRNLTPCSSVKTEPEHCRPTN